ncbi:MAG: hypothetical protein K5662_03180 [Lachnospiraceae bacterium]|nr:hypothetical protein [Lachnospiraceae bacterium]
MNNSIKKLVFILLSLTLVLSLCGCTNFAKQKALEEYLDVFSEDSAQWDVLGEVADDIRDSSRTAIMVSKIQKNVVPEIATLIEKGEKRNAEITDPEIRAIDDHYLEMTKKMKSGFELLAEGINQNSIAKVNLAKDEINVAADEAKGFIDELDAYTTRYDIRTTDALDELRNEIYRLQSLK